MESKDQNPAAGSESEAPRDGEGRDPNVKKGPHGIDKGIAQADKRARTGKNEEPVRNTPPAGAWNDTSAD